MSELCAVRKFLDKDPAVSNYLEKIGIPGRDAYELQTSEKRFSDGAQYRLEVPGIQSPETAKAVMEAAKNFSVTINRITETRGIFRLTDNEIEQMVEIAKEARAELVLSHGPRAMYDTSAQYAVGGSEAGRIGYRLRGADQLVRAIADVKRATDMGCRGILVYDEGLLWVLNNMRKDEILPKSTKLKVSAHCGHGNPASIRVLADLGADSVNPVRDLQHPMIAAIRRATDIALDIHVDNPKSTGGFIRTYEAPEFVRIGSPLYLKCGASVFGTHAWPTSTREAVEVAKQCSLVQRMIERYYPEAAQSRPGSKGLAVPE